MVPALEKQVQAGRLTGFGYFAHRIGGAWRRLDSWTAPDVERVLAAQDAVMEEVNRPTFLRLEPPLNQVVRFIPFSRLSERLKKHSDVLHMMKAPDFLEYLSESCEIEDE